MSLRFYLYLFCAWVTTFTTAHVSGEASSFESGIKAYEQGDYEAARAEFEASVEIKETPAARHNLGLALFQSGEFAQAAWQLERALVLDPLNRNYREKRNLIRRELGLSENPDQWYAMFSQWLPVQVWLGVATVSFWLLVAALVLPALNGRNKKSRIQMLRCSSLLVLALSCTAVSLNLRTLKTGIVLSEETASLHAAPASAAPESGFARSGERARILDQHEGFYRIKTEGSAIGWMAKENFQLLGFQENQN